MKTILVSIGVGLLGFGAISAQAADAVGAVYCDANTNRVIDAEDVPVGSLLVVVTNLSGTFSNANWTGADGGFVVPIPEVADSYVHFVHPATRPPGTTEVIPAVTSFTTTAPATSVTNFFLLENLGCVPMFKVGHVYCDANGNGVIDRGDVPVPEALVVVTNVSGTFSNVAHTDLEGYFSVELPPGAGEYADFIVRRSLPPGSHLVLPEEAFEFSFPRPNGSNRVTNNFLIRNPRCLSVPEGNNLCWLTGRGAIRSRGGLPIYQITALINPGCRPSPGGGGNFGVLWRPGNLRLRALEMAVVNCGNLPGLPPGSRSPKTPYNYIDFEGVGTLSTGDGDQGLVRFSARAVDGGEPGRRDRLYLRVFDPADEDRTLMLISGNPDNPMAVTPVALSSGNLQMHVSGCR